MMAMPHFQAMLLICVSKPENSGHTELWYIIWQLIMMSHGRIITADRSMEEEN